MISDATLIDDFLKFLTQFVKISDRDIRNFILPSVELRSFNKRAIITAAGEIENFTNFVQQGLLRKYYLVGKQEMVTQFCTEGEMISSIESFYSRQPSEYYIDALEDTRLVSIQYDALEKIFASSHNLERLGRLVTVHSVVQRDRWSMNQMRNTPRERFLNFVDNYPKIMQRVPQKHLASYLNIQPETFSRFKHLRKGKSE